MDVTESCFLTPRHSILSVLCFPQQYLLSTGQLFKQLSVLIFFDPTLDDATISTLLNSPVCIVEIRTENVRFIQNLS
jgi:hypothetical protein